MLRSMTGFGTAGGLIGPLQYTVEIRAVNNRYLRTVVKLPEVCSALEPQVDGLLRQSLGRGTVTLSLRARLGPDRGYQLNVDVLSQYVDQLRPVEVGDNPLIRIDLASLLQLPGVLETPGSVGLEDADAEAILGLVDSALHQLDEMRRKEGSAVKADLLGYAKQLIGLLDHVAQRAPSVVAEHQAKLTIRVQELLAGTAVSLDPDALAREIAIFAERCDIAEEIARLKAHIEQFTQTITGASEPVGRKLDFIAQEMMREANTIASKANDSSIVETVVEIKTTVDRIKEQVQNVE
jgi:uncharacterized protein (TIGR00255 family)